MLITLDNLSLISIFFPPHLFLFLFFFLFLLFFSLLFLSSSSPSRLSRQEDGVAKVAQLGKAIGGEKDVGRLQVTVDNGHG